jgi:transcriptional regulator with XRE-family HTH domain
VRASEIVRTVRKESGLSVRALADAAGVASSTVHRIERGDISPTVETLDRIAAAAGMAVRAIPRPDHRLGLVGLAQCIRGDLQADPGDHSTPVRRAAELVARTDGLDEEALAGMLAVRPPSTGDRRWDAFVAGLAEWIAVTAGLPAPRWAQEPDRFLGEGWWVSAMPSMRAWEYAGAPTSLKVRGVYLHRASLVNV